MATFSIFTGMKGLMAGIGATVGSVTKEALGVAIGRQVPTLIQQNVVEDPYGEFDVVLNSLPREETQNLRRRIKAAKAEYRQNKVVRLLMKIPAEHMVEQYRLFDRLTDEEFEDELMHLENDTAAELLGRLGLKAKKALQTIDGVIAASGLDREVDGWAQRQRQFRDRQRARNQRKMGV